MQGSLRIVLPQGCNANVSKCSNHDNQNYGPYYHHAFSKI